MKMFERLLVALFAVFLLLAQSPALAANLRFEPQPQTTGGAMFGRIPLSKFGSLDLPRGRATFKSHIVEISAVAEYQFERQVVLSGPVIKCSTIQSGKNTVVNGIAYFQDGEWLRYIDNSNLDKITTLNGVYEGQITALKNGTIELTTGALVTNIAIDQIVAVNSPRAYTFSMVVTPYLVAPAGTPMSGETATVSMRPSADVISLSVVKHDPLMAGDGDVSTKKLVVLGTTLAAVQLCQFIPMAIVFGPLRNSYAHQFHARMAQYYGQENFQNAFYTSGQNIPITRFAPGYNASGGGL